jgi:hypothetical protein
VQHLAGRRLQLLVVIGPSVAPKNTVWLVTWRMPPPEPID